MRVLHITTNDSGGAGLCCLRIHQALLDLGVESKVLALHNTKKVKEEYSYGKWQYVVYCKYLTLRRFLGFPVSEQEKLRILRETYHTMYTLPLSPINLLNSKWVKWADVIHLHFVANYLDYPTFFGSIKKPIVWTLHDENFFLGIAHFTNQALLDNEQEKKYARLKRECVTHVANLSIVMLSDSFLTKFKDEIILRNRVVKVINNCVDTDLFVPASKKNARSKYGLNSEDVVFALTAFFIDDPRKGLDLLSQALLEFNNPHLKIIAIGKNPENKKWPNVISVGLCENVEDICEVLSASNYYAMPSFQEGFAQSPLEAMACGLPVVAFPVSGTSELINEDNGVICNDFTVKSLKVGISTLLKRTYDPKIIRNDIINRFSPSIIAHKYLSLYNEQMGNS